MSISSSIFKSKISLFLERAMLSALHEDAAACGRDTTEHAERILVEYLINGHLIDPLAGYKKRVFWYLTECAVYEALELCRGGKRSRTITLDAIRVCTRDHVWASLYRFYVGDDIFKHGLPAKGEINREFGWKIKRAVGGEVEKDANGKPVNQKVLGEIIQSFTPLNFPNGNDLPLRVTLRPEPPALPKDNFGTTIDPLNPPNEKDRFHAQPGDIQFVTIR